MATTRHRLFWKNWSNEDLLDLRFNELGLTVEGSWLEGPIETILEDLERRDLRIKPHFWLSREWFTPADTPGIAIPFYLAHERTIKLERSQMTEVEGGSLQECLKILRHEVGHVIQIAYQLHRRRRWQQLFGRSSARYPDYYRFRPGSKRYVQHLDYWYAQSHPDEDFAETFAVWFRPRALWKKNYAGWSALKKLQYVDELMHELAGARPVVTSRQRVDSLPRLRNTLRAHYRQKIKRYPITSPTLYDDDLRRLFSNAPRHRGGELAGAFLRRNQSEIGTLVSRWAGDNVFTIGQVFRDLMNRCRELKLHVVGSERQLKLNFAILLTVKTMNYLKTRNHWHRL